MSTVERTVVGRKTPRDGKLEVSPALAHTLGGDRAPIHVRLASSDLAGSVEVMECTCAKAGASGKHEHHFVQCDAFRALTIGTDLVLRADGSILEVAPV